VPVWKDDCRIRRDGTLESANKRKGISLLRFRDQRAVQCVLQNLFVQRLTKFLYLRYGMGSCPIGKSKRRNVIFRGAS
jgi:hypothetical protein